MIIIIICAAIAAMATSAAVAAQRVHMARTESAIEARQRYLIHAIHAPRHPSPAHWTEDTSDAGRHERAFEAAWIAPAQETIDRIDRELGIRPDLQPVIDTAPAPTRIQRATGYTPGQLPTERPVRKPESDKNWTRERDGSWTPREVVDISGASWSKGPA